MKFDQHGVQVRAVAARAIHAVVDEGRSLDRTLPDLEHGLPPAERALLRMLCFGSLRFYWHLSAAAEGLLTRPLKRRDRVVHALLVLGIFQLSEMRVAQHAAVSLTVEAARLLRRPKLKGLVNAVLRKYLREPPPSPDTDPVRFDHPQWFIDRLRTDWPSSWQQMLAANNERAPMWLRINRRVTTRGAYREELARAAGVSADDVSLPEPGLDDALRLLAPRPVSELPGFEAGAVSVQDAAAQIAAPWLLQHGGGRLLDACAAPGGKTAHLKELGGKEVALTAVEMEPERAALIRDALSRLGLSATVLVGDASNPEDWWDGEAFDGILLDAPCSASGVVRRHPDAKHLRRASDIARLADRQRRLLDSARGLLKPSGKLLYVTCSVFAEENDAVIEYALRQHADLRVNNVLPNNNIHALMCQTAFGFQVQPGTRGLDGFYFACLEKQTDQ